MDSVALGVVFLGAGASARMGRPKLLLPWGGTSILGHLIGQWRALAAEQIAVVGAARDTTLAAAPHRGRSATRRACATRSRSVMVPYANGCAASSL